MAKKKSEDSKEVEVVEVEITETVEEVKSIEELVEDFKEAIEEVEETLIEPESYEDNDIVEFYNLRGDLRYAPYGYITKRGYIALRKYTNK